MTRRFDPTSPGLRLSPAQKLWPTARTMPMPKERLNEAAAALDAREFTRNEMHSRNFVPCESRKPPSEMTDELVPDDLRSFILEHIDSVAQLEALLLLRREAGREWDAESTARRLYVSDTVAGEILSRLRADGLLSSREGFFRYAPASPELAAMIDRLAAIYSRALIPVTNIVHNNPLRLRKFADAFRFRKDK
jgi:hypothetical protein